MNSTLLKKYETIDQSKVSEKDKKVLEQVKKLTNGFEETDEAKNKVAEKILNQITMLNPDAVKKPQVVAQKVAKVQKVAKAKKPKTASKSSTPTAKGSGNNIMSVAKEIQKSGESWKDAMERAKQVLKERKEGVVAQKKSELQKLYELVKTKKELKGFSNSEINRDASRTAKPRGARVVTKQGSTSNQYGTFDNKLGRKYWETRDRHADRLAPNYPKDMPLLGSGGEVKSVVDALFEFNEKRGKLNTSFGAKTKEGITSLIENDNYTSEEIAKAIFFSNNKKEKISTGYGDKSFFGLKDMIDRARDKEYADGGMTNLTMQNVSFADGGITEEKLLKELRKLQRDLNSSRLSTYIEGDDSQEEKDRTRERESKLARFNEVLRLLRENNAKLANGGSLPFMTDPNFGNFQNTGAFANGGSIGDLTEQEFLKKYFGASVFAENPSQYFEIKKLSSSDDAKVNAFVKELKADGFTVKKRAFSDFTSVMGVKKKGSFESGGNIDGTMSFHENDYERLINDSSEDYPFFSIKSGSYQEIKKEKDEKTVAKWFPKTRLLKIKRPQDKDLVEWLNRNSYLSQDEYEKFELGGAFMMTDLAGHTGGSDGIGNPMPLSGVSGTHYTGLVGETGTMSSGEMFEAGGAMMQNQQVIDGASQSYVNYYLGEGASQGIYKDGGDIPNNYEGRTAKDVWNNWTSEQKTHFMQDHKYDIFGDRQISKEDREKFLMTKFEDLSRDLRIIVEDHVQEGQYAFGGKTKVKPSMKELYIEQIASSTGTRTVGVENFVNDNALTETELSNLMTGIGRGMISRSDFVTAITGNKGNVIQKEVIAFAKSDKAYKMADGGAINGMLNKKIQNLADVRGFEIGDWATSEYNKIMIQALVESLTDANFHDEAKQVVLKAEGKTKWSDELYQSEYFNPDEKVGSFAREVARICEWDGDDILNAYFFITKMAGSKVGTMIEDLFLKAKPNTASSKTKKYINHDDIKTVTVTLKGKQTTFKGEDVLNGANLMEDGGDLSKIAFYIPKRDVISVELKNGETIKPANGYWIKKGAEPLSTPSTNPTNKTDESKAHFQADAFGNVFVDSNFVNQSKGNLPNTELKHYGYGDFYLQTPDGNIDFIRTNEEKEGFVGRTHKMKGSDELVLKLVNAMKEKDRFESTQTFADGGFMNNVYANGGEIQEDDRVIITTKSLGKDYEGMTGVVTSRKLLNNKYSIKLSNGIEMAFDRSEFRHNSINPRFAKGGELKGKFLTEIKVPYNFEYVVEDKFEFTEFLSKTLTKKWFGNGVWGVTIVKPLFEKNYGQKIVVEIEIPVGVTQGGGLDKFDVGEFISKTLTKKWFGNGIWGVDIVSSYANGGNLMDVHDGTAFMNNPVYAKDGAMLDDNDGFMRADNNYNYRYPEMEVYIETIDEPIDLTDSIISTSNEVVIRPLDEDIDLKDDGRIRARMTQSKRGSAENFGKINSGAFEFINLPMPTSNKHKND